MSDEIKDCARCGEDAVLIDLGPALHGNRYYVRVRRSSKCKMKRVNPPGAGICITDGQSSAETAIQIWNENYGKSDK